MINPVIDRRLSELEAVLTPPPPRQCHLLAAMTDEEQEALQAEMIERGEATSGDMFIFLVPPAASVSP